MPYTYCTRTCTRTCTNNLSIYERSQHRYYYGSTKVRKYFRTKVSFTEVEVLQYCVRVHVHVYLD